MGETSETPGRGWLRTVVLRGLAVAVAAIAVASAVAGAYLTALMAALVLGIGWAIGSRDTVDDFAPVHRGIAVLLLWVLQSALVTAVGWVAHGEPFGALQAGIVLSAFTAPFYFLLVTIANRISQAWLRPAVLAVGASILCGGVLVLVFMFEEAPGRGVGHAAALMGTLSALGLIWHDRTECDRGWSLERLRRSAATAMPAVVAVATLVYVMPASYAYVVDLDQQTADDIGVLLPESAADFQGDCDVSFFGALDCHASFTIPTDDAPDVREHWASESSTISCRSQADCRRSLSITPEADGWSLVRASYETFD